MDIEKNYKKYERLAAWIARRIYDALPLLPKHIKDEFVFESRYALIQTLNTYKRSQTISLKTAITYHCFNHLSNWWCRTYVGCKSHVTQKKHGLWPIGIADLAENIPEKIFESTPLLILRKNEEEILLKKFVKKLQKRLGISTEKIEVLMYTYSEYNKKYPGKLTAKGHDNLRQQILNFVRTLIENNPKLRDEGKSFLRN